MQAESQTPENTYLPGDTVSVGFRFHHEMNVQQVTATFSNQDTYEQVQLEGYPKLEATTGPTKTSTVEVEGFIRPDTPPGEYRLINVTARTSAENELRMSGLSAGVLSFWVIMEPQAKPRFEEFP